MNWWQCKCGETNPPLSTMCINPRCRRSRPDYPFDKPVPKPVPKPEPMPRPHPNMPESPKEEPKTEDPKPVEPKKNPNPALVRFSVWFGIASGVATMVSLFVPQAKPFIVAIVAIIKGILTVLGV